jgi:excisionase family DNA binding protein
MPHDELTGNERLLTIADVTALLRVSKWSVYQLIWSGRLRTLTIGRRRLVRPSALAECVELLDGKAA